MVLWLAAPLLVPPAALPRPPVAAVEVVERVAEDPRSPEGPLAPAVPMYPVAKRRVSPAILAIGATVGAAAGALAFAALPHHGDLDGPVAVRPPR